MKTKSYQLGFDALILRFYLLMAIVLVAGFLNVWALAFLSLPVFLSCLVGIGFTMKKRSRVTQAGATRTKKAFVESPSISSRHIGLEL